MKRIFKMTAMAAFLVVVMAVSGFTARAEEDNADENLGASMSESFPDAKEIKLNHYLSVNGDLQVGESAPVNSHVSCFKFTTPSDAKEGASYCVYISTQGNSGCRIYAYTSVGLYKENGEQVNHSSYLNGNNAYVTMKYLFNLDPGQTYYIRILNKTQDGNHIYLGTPLDGKFKIGVTNIVAGSSIENAPKLYLEEYEVASPNRNLKFKYVDHGYCCYIDESMASSSYFLEIVPKTYGKYQIVSNEGFFSFFKQPAVLYVYNSAGKKIETLTQVLKNATNTTDNSVYFAPDNRYYIWFQGGDFTGTTIGLGLVEKASDSKLTPTPTPMPSATPTLAPSDGTRFTDVDSSKYYAEPVNWAVSKAITSGTSKTTFEPSKECTRAQVVTFLWRALGCPEPQSTNPFTDITDANAYYYKAVLWASQNGITSGTTPTTFSPNQTVTRAQFVTFLYRAKNKPDISSANPFSDLKIGAYYFEAVLWAYQNNITTGKSVTIFAPDEPCNRGQVVTFLYRAYK